jgi:aryl-alcohol dehydrogenase-like predicted oxidoreductase
MNINTKYPLSNLTFGCEPLGGTDWGKIDIPEIRKSIEFAFDNGINVFDVADVYGLGNAEMELSKALGLKIKDVFVITKFGVRWEYNENGKRALTYKDTSPKYMVQALESSLSRLNLDCIPLYFIHWPDNNTKLDETIEALEKVKSEGKILNYGISNFFNFENESLFSKYKISAFQGPLSLIDFKRAINVFNTAKKAGVTTFSYGPLAQGLLTGKFNQFTRFENDDRRSRLPHFQLDEWELNNKILEALNSIAFNYNKSASQIAIRWVIDNCKIDSVIIGAKNISQVRSNLETLDFILEKNDIEILNNIIGYNYAY